MRSKYASGEHVYSKFNPKSGAYEVRRMKLAAIVERMRKGERFDDLQGYDEGELRKMYPARRGA